MCNLDDSSVDPNVPSKGNKIPNRTQEPGEEISRGNVGKKCIVLDQGYRIDGDEKLMLCGKISLRLPNREISGCS